MHLQPNPSGTIAYLVDGAIEVKDDPLLLHQALDFGGDIRVFPVGDLVSTLNHGYLAAHPSVELGHLQADVATSHDGQMGGQFRTVQPVFGMEEIDLIEAVHGRYQGSSAGIQNHLCRNDLGIAHLNAEAIAIICMSHELRVPS